MFKHFFKKSNDDDIFETVDPIVEQRRNEKFSKPLIYDEEFKKEEVTKKSEGQQVPKETTSKNVKKVEKKEEMKSFLNHLFMTKNLKKKKLLKKVKVNKYQKKLLPKMLKRLKKK